MTSDSLAALVVVTPDTTAIAVMTATRCIQPIDIITHPSSPSASLVSVQKETAFERANYIRALQSWSH